ncbi:MAG: hypothetical protein JW846_01305 [Dehalococcoidia bacterium]|nr:hypothetical protein [Dehalococcoidia bacterium]
MTVVNVNCGICGQRATINVSKNGATQLHVSVETNCEMLREAAEQMDGADWREALRPGHPHSVHAVMFGTIKHAGCPGPTAMAKAIEVAVGVALPRDVAVSFQREER